MDSNEVDQHTQGFRTVDQAGGRLEAPAVWRLQVVIDQADGWEGDQGAGLAGPVRLGTHVVQGAEGAQEADPLITQEEQDGQHEQHPGMARLADAVGQVNEGRECGQVEDLVHHGIGIPAQARGDLELARKVAVKEVGDGGQDHRTERHQEPRLGQRVSAEDAHAQEQEDERDPDKRERLTKKNLRRRDESIGRG